MALTHPFCQCDDPGPGPGPGPGPDPGPITLAGDVTGPSDDTTVEAIQRTPVDSTPPPGRVPIVYDPDDNKAKWQAIDAEDVAFSDPGMTATKAKDAILEAAGLLAHVEIELPTDGNPMDTLVYTVPACKDATITFIKAVVSEPMTGSGKVNVRVGDSQGDDDYLIDHEITSSSAGCVAGDDIAGLAELFLANKGYVAKPAANGEVWARLAPTGQVLGGKVYVRVYGEVIT